MIDLIKLKLETACNIISDDDFRFEIEEAIYKDIVLHYEITIKYNSEIDTYNFSVIYDTASTFSEFKEIIEKLDMFISACIRNYGC